MDIKVTKSTKITLTPQEVQEAISQYLKTKLPNDTPIIAGDIEFKINVHDDEKMKGAVLTIVEKQ
jgi:hypothetical protein